MWPSCVALPWCRSVRRPLPERRALLGVPSSPFRHTCLCQGVLWQWLLKREQQPEQQAIPQQAIPQRCMKPCILSAMLSLPVSPGGGGGQPPRDHSAGRRRHPLVQRRPHAAAGTGDVHDNVCRLHSVRRLSAITRCRCLCLAPASSTPRSASTVASAAHLSMCVAHAVQLFDFRSN